MANKTVQLVDKNSNNLYPVAGAVITDAVSTGAISSQAVTNAKIENGAVNGVENNAIAIGTAKLALDTVGTPNLRDASVTSDKIDWTTYERINFTILPEGELASRVSIAQNRSFKFGKLVCINISINVPLTLTTVTPNTFCRFSPNIDIKDSSYVSGTQVRLSNSGVPYANSWFNNNNNYIECAIRAPYNNPTGASVKEIDICGVWVMF